MACKFFYHPEFDSHNSTLSRSYIIDALFAHNFFGKWGRESKAIHPHFRPDRPLGRTKQCFGSLISQELELSLGISVFFWLVFYYWPYGLMGLSVVCGCPWESGMGALRVTSVFNVGPQMRKQTAPKKWQTLCGAETRPWKPLEGSSFRGVHHHQCPFDYGVGGEHWLEWLVYESNLWQWREAAHNGKQSSATVIGVVGLDLLEWLFSPLVLPSHYEATGGCAFRSSFTHPIADIFCTCGHPFLAPERGFNNWKHGPYYAIAADLIWCSQQYHLFILTISISYCSLPLRPTEIYEWIRKQNDWTCYLPFPPSIHFLYTKRFIIHDACYWSSHWEPSKQSALISFNEKRTIDCSPFKLGAFQTHFSNNSFWKAFQTPIPSPTMHGRQWPTPN